MSDDDSSTNNASSNDSSTKAPILEIVLFVGVLIMLLSAKLGWGRFSWDKLSWDMMWRDRSANHLTTPPPPAAVMPSAPNPPTVPTPATQTPIAQPSAITPAAGGPADEVAPPAGTHQVLCAAGDSGLNFRPQAGFSAPLFVIPCGQMVTVTGAPVMVQNETWSPVFYANRHGWAATKLLRSIR